MVGGIWRIYVKQLRIEEAIKFLADIESSLFLFHVIFYIAQFEFWYDFLLAFLWQRNQSMYDECSFVTFIILWIWYKLNINQRQNGQPNTAVAIK